MAASAFCRSQQCDPQHTTRVDSTGRRRAGSARVAPRRYLVVKTKWECRLYTTERYAGDKLNGYRRRQLRLRKRLQEKGTKSARRLLTRRRKKEARHAANVNHRIAKTIVTEAARTGRGIAVEDLTGIRDRVRLRKPQRVTLHSWSFHQLGAFLAYKARRAGVPLIQIDPRYTSQTCHGCGHRDQRNRPDQETFHCRSCGVVVHADHNAALNIAQRGVEGWGVVNRPHAASPCVQ